VTLEVNTVTGSVSLVGTAATPVAFDYYTITSAGSALDPTGWNSFDDQNLDAIGGGTGENWDESDPSDASELTEFYLLGASSIANGERLPLGHAYNPSIAGQGQDGDLLFRFSRQGSQILRAGDIVYVTPEPLDGDYNNDLEVNAADYTIWRNTLGDDMDLRADGDGDGVVDRDDFIVWKWTYGNTAGSGAISQNGAVPEPSTALLAALFALLVVSNVRKLTR
jgi:hypothetical protein